MRSLPSLVVSLQTVCNAMSSFCLLSTKHRSANNTRLSKLLVDSARKTWVAFTKSTCIKSSQTKSLLKITTCPSTVEAIRSLSLRRRAIRSELGQLKAQFSRMEPALCFHLSNKQWWTVCLKAATTSLCNQTSSLCFRTIRWGLNTTPTAKSSTVSTSL